MDNSLIPYEGGSEAVEMIEKTLSPYVRAWETRGRGWDVFMTPVEIESSFFPFYNLLQLPEKPVFDDGRKESFFSRLTRGNSDNSSSSTALLASYKQELIEYESALSEQQDPFNCRYYNEEFIELQLVLPKELNVPNSVAENLIASFSYLNHPVSFEVIGTKDEIIIQFASTEKDLSQVKQQITSHIPECFLKETSFFLTDHWINGGSSELIVDFGLSNQFALPLKTPPETDFLITATGAVSDLMDNEIGVVQILFQKTQEDWANEVFEAINYFEGISPFSETKHLIPLAKEKLRFPLFAVCIRVASRAFHDQRAWQILRNLGAGLTHLSNPVGNELIPLSNEDYPEDHREQALLNRQSFRTGMLLNSREVVALVHPPSENVRSEKLLRESEKTKPAPDFVLGNSLLLGENLHQNEKREITLSTSQRTRHTHLIGASGSGKSTLMLKLIKQDLELGNGFCVIDPHGDLIDDVLEHIPENRINDIIFFDPADERYPIGFNILKANSELEKTLLSSDLVATFRRLSTSWGDVMDSVLSNAILAFVESKRGGTLFELKRFLVEKEFREKFLETVTDEAVRYFWQKEFPLLTGKPQSSILIRLDTFLRQKLIRNIVCQKKSSLNFREVMDNKKVLLLKLSQGAIGEENSYLLGTLMVSKLHQIALSRQDTKKRPFFALYMDEFQNFITPSMENILSGVRKYNIGLILAHQEFRQMQSRNSEVASSVLSNCYTRICFRLGDGDTERFERGFSFFDRRDLQNLGVGEAIVRVERAEYDFNLKTFLLPEVEKEIADEKKQKVLESSRVKYASLQEEVEKDFLKSASINKQKDSKKQKEIKDKTGDEIKEIVTKQKRSEKEEISLEQHRYLQKIIKRIGERYGFISTVEKQVFGGVGKIDVVLEKDDLRIACEVANTNTVDYEIQNIQKGFTSGFQKVVVISQDTRHLNKIKRRAKKCLSRETLDKVHFLEPENFHLFLENLKSTESRQDSIEEETRIRGYKVKAQFNSEEKEGAETVAITKTIMEVIREAIRRKLK